MGSPVEILLKLSVVTNAFLPSSLQLEQLVLPILLPLVVLSQYLLLQMRHSLKYPKMLLMDSSLTRKLLPKCCSVMLYLVPSLPWDCSYQHISTQLLELQKTELELRCTDPALLKCSRHQMLLK